MAPLRKKWGFSLTVRIVPCLFGSMFAGFKTNSDKCFCQFLNLDSFVGAPLELSVGIESGCHHLCRVMIRYSLVVTITTVAIGDRPHLYHHVVSMTLWNLESAISLKKMTSEPFFVRDFWTEKNLRAKNNRSLKNQQINSSMQIATFYMPPPKKKTIPPSTSTNHQARGGVAMDVGPTNKMDGLDLMDVFNLLSWKHQAEKISFSQNLVMTGKSNGCSLQV